MKTTELHMPAEVDLEEFLSEIQRKISGEEVGRTDLYRILLYIIDKELAESRRAISNRNLPEIPVEKRVQVSNLFDEVLADIQKFSDSEVVQKHLLGRILVWVAAEVALPYSLPLRSSVSLQMKRT